MGVTGVHKAEAKQEIKREAFFAGMGVTVVCKAEAKQEITRAAFFAGKGVTGSIVHLTLDGVDGK